MCKGCHVIVCKLRIKSLTALAKAVHRLGGELKLHQKTYKWFGRRSWSNEYDYKEEDAAYKNGVRVEDYGSCAHALHFPDCSYEMGLISDNEGGYKVVFDHLLPDLKDKVGGQEANKLLQLYALEVAKETAAMHCHPITEESYGQDGTIQLKVQVQE